MGTFEAKTQTLRDGRDVVIRHLTPTDALAFVAFHQVVVRETQFTMQRPESPDTVERAEKRFAHYAADPQSVFLGLFAEGELAGMAEFHPEWAGHPWVRHLREFGTTVQSAYWGSGAAALLMAALFDEASRQGVLRIQGHVRANNVRGLAFYTRLGFVVEGTRRMAAIIDDVALDEHTIAAFLPRST